MSTQTSPRDLEALSAYLDEQLPVRERAHLEARLKAESELRMVLEEFRRTRAAIRSLPKLRAPRNYLLNEKMVGIRQRPLRFYPVLRLASVLATFLLMLTVLGDFFLPPVFNRTPLMVSRTEETSQAVFESPAQTQSFVLEGGAPQVEAEQAVEKSMAVTEAPVEAPAPTQAMEMLIVPAETKVQLPLVPPGQGIGGENRVATPSEGHDIEPLPMQPTPQATATVPAALLLADSEATVTVRPIEPSPRAVGRDALRVLEFALASIALVTGATALYVRRKVTR